MYQALYRKWRPLTFDDVVGQEHITETLKSQVKNDRLSHAYLFVGTRGTGKTTCAKILSRAVNCENPVDGNPCNKCKACLGILNGSVMDVEEMDAASNNGVDNVRALRDEAVFSPASVKKRVYIIDEVHMLSASAFNALLKILEEPPAHLMFILATTELHKVPATILSRCQRYSFRRIDSRTMAKRLQVISEGEGITLAKQAAEILARLSEGSMRDAISLLDQCASADTITAENVLMAMGLSGNLRTAQLLELIADGDTEAAIKSFTKLWMDGKEPATLLDELASLYRDVLMTKIAPKGSAELISGGYDPRTLSELGDKLSNESLLNNLSTVQKAQMEIKGSLSPRVTAEMCIVTLCSPELNESVASLSARLARLESAQENGSSIAVAKSAAKSVFMPPRAQTTPAAAPESAKSTPPWEIESDGKAVSEPETDPEQVADILSPSENSPNIRANTESMDEPKVSAQCDKKLWPQILASLKKVLPFGTYNIISDPFHAEGVLIDGELKLYVKNGFAMSLINTAIVKDSLKAAAQVKSVKIEEGSPPSKNIEPQNNKVDNLMKFGNVKFE